MLGLNPTESNWIHNLPLLICLKLRYWNRAASCSPGTYQDAERWLLQTGRASGDWTLGKPQDVLMCPPNKGPIRVLCDLEPVHPASCYLPSLSVACVARRKAETFHKLRSSPLIAVLHADEAKWHAVCCWIQMSLLTTCVSQCPSPTWDQSNFVQFVLCQPSIVSVFGPELQGTVPFLPFGTCVQSHQNFFGWAKLSSTRRSVPKEP